MIQFPRYKITRAVVMLSGGMDSVTLLAAMRLFYPAAQIDAVSFNYGQRHSAELYLAEENAAKYLAKWHLFDLSGVMKHFANLSGASLVNASVEVPDGHYSEEQMKKTVVPNRNMMMLSVATSFAVAVKADVVAYAAHSGDHAIYPDCRPDFIAAMAAAISHCDWSVPVLETPFKDATKADIAELGISIGVDYNRTWSCYKGAPENGHCGTCGTCVERLEALDTAWQRPRHSPATIANRLPMETRP